MKKLSRYNKVLALSLLMVMPSLSYAEIVDVNINDLVTKAIDTHPLVGSAISEKKATYEGVKAAKRNLLPTPSITSGYRRGGDVNTQVNLRQPLWTGGRLTANVNQAIFDDKAATEHIFEQQNQVAKNTIEAWRTYIAAIGMQRVYEENLKQLAIFEAMMQRRVQQGVSAKIELELMTNRILQQQNSYQAAKEQERIAIARLEQIIGDSIAKGTEFSVPPLDTLTKNAKEQATNYESMVFDEASFRNATVVKEFFQIESAKQSVIADKAANLPSLYVEYTRSLNSNADNDGQFNLGLNYQPGAGFANLALTKASQAKVEGLIQSQEASRRTIMENIQTQYQQFASAKDKEVSLIAASAGNQIVVDSYRRQFIAGRKSWLEVLNAIREQSDNKIELVRIRSEMLGAFYKLQVDLGVMGWQEFQFNRKPQPLFHPLDPVDNWMSDQDYLPKSVQSIPKNIKKTPNYLKNLMKKIKDPMMKRPRKIKRIIIHRDLESTDSKKIELQSENKTQVFDQTRDVKKAKDNKVAPNLRSSP